MARAFRAELLANHFTMLQFVVLPKPVTVEDAWPLAAEQELVAECAVVLGGITRSHHARILVNRDSRFCHERPELTNPTQFQGGPRQASS